MWSWAFLVNVLCNLSVVLVFPSERRQSIVSDFLYTFVSRLILWILKILRFRDFWAEWVGDGSTSFSWSNPLWLTWLKVPTSWHSNPVQHWDMATSLDDVLNEHGWFSTFNSGLCVENTLMLFLFWPLNNVEQALLAFPFWTAQCANGVKQILLVFTRRFVDYESSKRSCFLLCSTLDCVWNQQQQEAMLVFARLASTVCQQFADLSVLILWSVCWPVMAGFGAATARLQWKDKSMT